MTEIAPMLAVRDVEAAVTFYKEALDAEERWRLDGPDFAVAGLLVAGAPIYLASPSPNRGTSAPDELGTTTVRIELFVDDPAAVQAALVRAGAREVDAVSEHQHNMRGPAPITRMIQGSVIDPFGHFWLVGRVLE